MFNVIKKVACVECRQQKVKCDATGEYPCNRCQKRGLQCSLNPDFKRVYKRARLAEVEKQVKDLKSVLEAQVYPEKRDVPDSTAQYPEQFKKAQKISEGNILRSKKPVFSPLSSSINGNDTLTTLALERDKVMNSDQSVSQVRMAIAGQTNNSTGAQVAPIPSYLEIKADVNFASELPSPKLKHNQLASKSLPLSYDNNVPETENIMKYGEEEKGTSIIASVFCRPKTLENVTLNSEIINDLYQEYVNNYHTFLPFVDLKGGPEAIFSRSPPLFWTMMFVASRRYTKSHSIINGGDLTLRLGPSIKKCLAELAISPITRPLDGIGGTPVFNIASVYSVQAFLIYTTWPPVTSSLSADSSWNTCGIALFTAVRIGLHSPVHSSGHKKFNSMEKMNSKMSLSKISEQIRTWICCNIVSTSVATVFGFPSFTHFDSSTLLVAQQNGSRPEIPVVIEQMMTIAVMEEEIEKTLNSNPHDPFSLCGSFERLSLIKILAKKLDAMESVAANYDYTRRFMFLAVRVHLYTYYFLDNTQLSALQLEKGYMQVYNAALALLEHCNLTQCQSKHQGGGKRFQRYIPGTFVQVIWQTSCIIARIYHSPYAAVVDAEAGKRLYQVAARCLSEASILRHDLAYRASEIIRQIWHFYKHLNSRNISTTKVSIRTRFTASVLIDTLWVMREECGIRSMGPIPDTARGGAGPMGVENSDRAGHHENQSVDETTAATTKVFTSIPLDPRPILAAGNGGSFGEYTPESSNEVGELHISPHDPNAGSLSGSAVPTAATAKALLEPTGVRRTSQYPETLAGPCLESSSPLAVLTPLATQGGSGGSMSSGGGESQADITKWDMDAVWKDVDWLMTDFGFLVNG
ncbi:hypothetical protein NADFUDRAFT_49041 [Nadsonia fulvescens var. elongata DSM 6958]|uniref:Zn(2)-C6 fungal-type domain-containing protein n=1 Tax=Nadsonia fulvescens var. elongata DSM 6958 TaxID=857566 RepID=A0A1E3PU73_9ASCO|nr:hypothetical protein NADFUDRAFT_49041 [Nadsonia fulvescens var. elongata DSM 6958]